MLICFAVGDMFCVVLICLLRVFSFRFASVSLVLFWCVTSDKQHVANTRRHSSARIMHTQLWLVGAAPLAVDPHCCLSLEGEPEYQSARMFLKGSGANAIMVSYTDPVGGGPSASGGVVESPLRLHGLSVLRPPHARRVYRAKWMRGPQTLAWEDVLCTC